MIVGIQTVMTVGIRCILEDIREVKLKNVDKQIGLSKAKLYCRVGSVERCSWHISRN